MYKKHDVTEDCKALLRFIQESCGDASSVSWGKNFTSTYMVDVFYGSKSSKIKEGNDFFYSSLLFFFFLLISRRCLARSYFSVAAHLNHPIHGRGSKWSRVDVDRLLHQLILEGYLVEKMTAMREDIVNAYVKLGPKANDLLSGNAKVQQGNA